MYKYTLAVTSPEYWNTIHNALIVDSNEDGIPDRKVTCSDTKEHSPTRGTYWLTEEEAIGISTHPQVKWIELSPSDYRYVYPDPEPATKRFRKNVKVYRDLSLHYPPTTATSAEENRTNWATKRVGIATNGDSWPNVTGNPAVINTDISYSLTGKNVDLVIQDSGVLQYHPEFIGDDGKSRVRDIILDGPYYIDPSYFTSNGYTYTKPDGRIGITTASAHGWWENSSNRSGSFSSIGTLSVPDAYTVANSLGIGGTSHTMTSSHGTGCAGLSAGKNFGLAFESNIWTISIFAPANISTEASYDALKIFHQHKPVNTVTGRKNPTVVNGSWGYYAGFNSGTQVYYSFKGSTGNFTGYSSSSTGVQALAYGLGSGLAYDRQYSTSSRSNSIDTAGDEMVDAGVIFVCAAGNDNQRLGIGTDDPHLNDYLTTLTTADARTGIPGATSGTNTCPSGHRNFIHPQRNGYNESKDFHPTICVGAMDEFIETNYKERQASYSNNGPGITVWAPADETLSAGMRAANGDQLGTETNYARYNSNFVDRYFNGTSAASPVVAGVVALFLESKPSATSGEVLDFIKTQASQMLSDTEWLNPYPTDNNAEYWRDDFNNRGAASRVLFDPTASDTRPIISFPVPDSIISENLVCHLDSGNSSSYSGSGTTWSDISGSSNNFTINGATFVSSGSSSYFDFDGTNDFVQGSAFNFGTDSFTIGMWVYLDTFDVLNDVFFATYDTTAGSAFSTNSFEVRRNGNNSSNGYPRWEHRMQIGGVKFEVGTGAAGEKGHFTGGKWHYYVCTFENSSSSPYGTVKLYLNSSLIVSGSSAAANGGQHNFTQNNIVYLGKNRPSVRYMDGRIAQLHVYKGSALTASEVEHNYDAMKGRYFDHETLILSGISFQQT